jgi:hypothetical protein
MQEYYPKSSPGCSHKSRNQHIQVPTSDAWPNHKRRPIPVRARSKQKSRRKEILTVSGSGMALPSSPGAAPARSMLRATLSTSSIRPASRAPSSPIRRPLLSSRRGRALPRRETPGDWCSRQSARGQRCECCGGSGGVVGGVGLEMRRNKRESKSRGREQGWKILVGLAELVDLSRLLLERTNPSFQVPKLVDGVDQALCFRRRNTEYRVFTPSAVVDSAPRVRGYLRVLFIFSHI